MESIRSLFLLTKVFGFSAYTYRHPGTPASDRTVVWSRSGLAWAGVNVAAYVYFTVQNVNRGDLLYADSGSRLLDVGGQFILGASYSAMVAAIVVRLARSNLVGTISHQFQRIDQRMDALGLPVDYECEKRLLRNYFVTLLCFVTAAVIGGLYALYLMGNLWHGMAIYGGQIYVSYTGSVLATNSIAMVLKLFRRISVINEGLRNDFRVNLRLSISKSINPDENASFCSSESLHHKISAMALIYDDIYQLSHKISYFVWLEITSYCCIVVIYGIMTLFATYRALLTTHFHNIVSSGMHLVWWFEYCVGILVVLATGHMLEQSTKGTLDLLGAAIIKEGKGLVGKKLRAFMQQINHNPPRVTTWFFDVNLSVFYSMMGTMATFLFMMIQFDR